MTHIVYIADPMCSWCYGFGPELAGLLKKVREPRLDIIMGGLRVGGREQTTPEFRRFLLAHWAQVETTCGLQFNPQALDAPGFVYDTEPVCRAFASVQLLYPELNGMTKLALLGSLQKAFYQLGQDVTQADVLAKCVSQCLTRLKHPTTEQQFLATFGSQQAQVQTQAHFAQAERWNISSFPALLVVKGEELSLLSSGYTKTATLVEHLKKILA